jgi:pyrimidine-nucleoside phosphorylase
MVHIPSLIERKRDGGAHSREEIAELIEGYTNGSIPDYQMSAWAMAVYFSGMTPEETATLTLAMRDSGKCFRWPAGTPLKLDKHSTGGVGDKVSLVLAPLLAAAGFWVPMVSGRGLGLTGGTLDKLEAIPGFCTALTEKSSLAQLEKIGVFLAGQTSDFCPADRRLYALRDVTATVPSRPLIVASILSKKLAECLDRLVLDVKYGSGAFMQSEAEAKLLSEALVATAQAAGLPTRFVLTPMHEPLGCTVGNALEVRESVLTLQNQGPPDLVDLTLRLASEVSELPRDTFAKLLADGSAWQIFQKLVEAQGGDVASLDLESPRPPAPVVLPLASPADGILQSFDAGTVGRVVVMLGGGRQRTDDVIDYRVGLSGILKTGTQVSRDQPLAWIHAATQEAAQAAKARLLQSAIIINHS